MADERDYLTTIPVYVRFAGIGYEQATQAVNEYALAALEHWQSQTTDGGLVVEPNGRRDGVVVLDVIDDGAESSADYDGVES